jgi:hypothetical protein
MKLHEAAPDGEPEPDPALAAAGRGAALPEALEEVGDELGIQSRAVVLHGELDVRVHAQQPDLHPPALGGELDGVREEVPDDLLEAVGIAGHRPDLRPDRLRAWWSGRLTSPIVTRSTPRGRLRPG